MELFFDRVIGHDRAKRILELALIHPQHGYVIAGQDGVGVHALAEAFVRRLLDEYTGESLRAHPDLVILEREPSDRGSGLKKEISVQTVRDLKVRVSQRPSIASRLVIYIPDADFLNEEGVNALLKCIEEPVVNAVYVFAAHASGKLPATLLSRVCEVRLDRVPLDAIEPWLRASGVGDRQAKDAVGLSDGRPGYAIRYATDQVFFNTVNEIEHSIRGLMEASTPEMMVGAVARTASACDAAEDSVAEWRKAVQLWQAALRRYSQADPQRVQCIGRALIAAEKAIGSSIPPRVWLELGLVQGFKRQKLPSLQIPKPFPSIET